MEQIVLGEGSSFTAVSAGAPPSAVASRRNSPGAARAVSEDPEDRRARKSQHHANRGTARAGVVPRLEKPRALIARRRDRPHHKPFAIETSRSRGSARRVRLSCQHRGVMSTEINGRAREKSDDRARWKRKTVTAGGVRESTRGERASAKVPMFCRNTYSSCIKECRRGVSIDARRSFGRGARPCHRFDDCAPWPPWSPPSEPILDVEHLVKLRVGERPLLLAIMLVGVSASRSPSTAICSSLLYSSDMAPKVSDWFPDFLLLPAVFFDVPLELSVDVGFRFDPSRLLCRSILRFVAWKRFLMALGDRPGISRASTAH